MYSKKVWSSIGGLLPDSRKLVLTTASRFKTVFLQSHIGKKLISRPLKTPLGRQVSLHLINKWSKFHRNKKQHEIPYPIEWNNFKKWIKHSCNIHSWKACEANNKQLKTEKYTKYVRLKQQWRVQMLTSNLMITC